MNIMRTLTYFLPIRSSRKKNSSSESSQAFSCEEAAVPLASHTSVADTDSCSTIASSHRAPPARRARHSREGSRGSSSRNKPDRASVTSDSICTSDGGGEATTAANARRRSRRSKTPDSRHREKLSERSASPVKHGRAADVRSSTPVSASSRENEHRRSSSLPPRRSSSRESRASDEKPSSCRSRRQRSEQRPRICGEVTGVDFGRRRLSPSVLPTPNPPTFLIIEKTMGQRSMVIGWTPPVLDMVIKYRIAVFSSISILNDNPYRAMNVFQLIVTKFGNFFVFN